MKNRQKFVLLSLCAALAACSDAQPVIKRSSSSKGTSKLSTKANFASAGGTAISGGYKIKFSLASNQYVPQPSQAPTQVTVSSGGYKIRASTAGVLHE